MEMRGRRNVLITGASGFVGRAIVAECLRGGWRVTALRNRRALATTPSVGVEEFRLDLLAENRAELLAALPRCDAIVHAAGAPKFVNACESEMRRLHVAGTLAVAREAARRGVRMVHISTAYVTPEAAGLLREAAPLAARGAAYERTKTEAEMLLAAGGFENVEVLRPAIVLTDEDDSAADFRESPLGVFLALLAGGRVVPGERGTPLAFCLRRDLGRITRAILESSEVGRTRWWNLCSPGSVRLGALSDALRAIRGEDSPRIERGSVARLAGWCTYLSDWRAWECDGALGRARELGVPLERVGAERIAAMLARNWDLRGSRGRMAPISVPEVLAS